MEGSSCVKKGAWSQVEDDLLTACVRQYGEGKWHLVPTRAGLNRCRKSCRLRWLNYLKPSIKRGKFGEDEVDMMKRMHRLLGNRWSLIAGRLPGRTPNDVKNYWNTHIIRKKVSCDPKESETNAKSTTKEIPKPNLVIKPQPRTFSSTALCNLKMRFTISSTDQVGDKHFPNGQSCATASPSISELNKWWGNEMEDKQEGGINIPENGKCLLGIQDGMLMDDDDFNIHEDLTADCLIEEDQTLSHFLDDINFWDF